jgi:multidrug efflux pump subunit AcrA (membrane-fusion protein)
MALKRGFVLGTVGTLIGVALGVVVAFHWLPHTRTHAARHQPLPEESTADEPPEGEEAIVVKTIHPKRDRTYTVTSQQYTTVEPYYQADLRARASGVIKYIPKDVGGRVSQGELLVEIDVPDLRQEVAQKEAVVDQRRQELRVAKAQLKNAAAHVDIARTAIDLAETQVEQAKATRDLREMRLNRFRQLRSDQAVNANIIDEETRDYQAAHWAWEAAKVAVKRAQADFREKEASLEAAQADILLKESLIEVAMRDRDRTRALADYARLTAPFDGVIVRREVDLGTFVQNATSSTTEPLVTVARTDVVTVVTRLPDNVAPFVTRDTRVLVQLDELPGVLLEGRVTRFAPSVMNQDRTMRVEVDLFNGGAAEYGKFLGEYFAGQFAAAAADSPLAAVELAAAGRDQLGSRLKSISDPLPLPPVIRGGAAETPHLLPGMSGQMRVQLQKFANAYLLPSSAVFTRGGKPYIMVLKDGVTHLLPIRVQVNDGRLAKVAVVSRVPNARGGDAEVLRELTGDEEVVASRQVELDEGQTVRAVPEDW